MKITTHDIIFCPMGCTHFDTKRIAMSIRSTYYFWLECPKCGYSDENIEVIDGIPIATEPRKEKKDVKWQSVKLQQPKKDEKKTGNPIVSPKIKIVRLGRKEANRRRYQGIEDEY